jgi:hypothetical protein
LLKGDFFGSHPFFRLSTEVVVVFFDKSDAKEVHIANAHKQANPYQQPRDPPNRPGRQENLRDDEKIFFGRQIFPGSVKKCAGDAKKIAGAARKRPGPC